MKIIFTHLKLKKNNELYNSNWKPQNGTPEINFLQKHILSVSQQSTIEN